LMENVMRVSSGITALGARRNVERGQIAIDSAANDLWNLLLGTPDHDRRVEFYQDFVSESVGGLTNYHRFVYHIIAYTERQFSEIPKTSPMTKDDPSYSYIQLLRAQLSDSEMQLMAFNALYGAGNPKLKLYIERYALFNNMPEVDIIEFELPRVFNHAAFGLLPSDRPEVVNNWKAP
jgi:hypothetical protein